MNGLVGACLGPVTGGGGGTAEVVAFQDVYLFDDTIHADNALTGPDAAEADIEAAARAAGIHDFVEGLPAYDDTRVGEIGSALSGRERQRISIARVRRKDAPIVLPDDPTAPSTSTSETVVQEAIDRLVDGKTVVVIAHRLSTIVGADQIRVLGDVRLRQRGTHPDLLAIPDDRYARMWAGQAEARQWQLPATAVHTEGPDTADGRRGDR